jgi:hypothetical protein
MDERGLRRIFRSAVLAAMSLPVATIGVACGSATSDDVGGESAGGAGAAGSGGAPSDACAPLPCPGSGWDPATCACREPDAATFDAAAPDVAADADADATSWLVSCDDAGSAPGCGDWCVATSDVTGVPDDGGVAPSAVCATVCVEFAQMCAVVEADASTAVVRCHRDCTGRRPAGLVEPPLRARSELGAHFAAMAYLEAASVHAFRALRDELRHHGAPRSLIRAAERAARDERRHARMTSALARRHGGVVPPVRRERTRARSIEAIALENAVEGCVRETYGATMATYQARVAADPAVRAALERIAADETRHAALAWRVAGWMNGRLEPGARRRIDEARRMAVIELVASASREPPAAVAHAAGVPRPSQAKALVAGLAAALFG